MLQYFQMNIVTVWHFQRADMIVPYIQDQSSFYAMDYGIEVFLHLKVHTAGRAICDAATVVHTAKSFFRWNIETCNRDGFHG